MYSVFLQSFGGKRGTSGRWLAAAVALAVAALFFALGPRPAGAGAPTPQLIRSNVGGGYAMAVENGILYSACSYLDYYAVTVS